MHGGWELLRVQLDWVYALYAQLWPAYSSEAQRPTVLTYRVLDWYDCIASGDAAFGDGVYLTTMEHQYGIKAIMENNWDSVAATKEDKLEAFFEILMPSTMAIRVKDKRDILVYKGDLKLSDYKWNLKSFDDGDLLATQYFRVTSSGRMRQDCMGRYTLYSHAVLWHPDLDNVPVYKQDNGNKYLYLAGGLGKWGVGPVIGSNVCSLQQVKKEGESPTPTPSKALPWQYHDGGWKDDATLKVYPFYPK